MVFFIAALVPACAFYLYALVNFQRELWNAKRPKSSGVEVIRIHLQEDLPGAHDSNGVVVPSESTVPLERVSGGLVHNRRRARLASDMGHAHEVYQLESAYVGPLFLVPLNDGAEDQLTSTGQYPEKAVPRHAV